MTLALAALPYPDGISTVLVKNAKNLFMEDVRETRTTLKQNKAVSKRASHLLHLWQVGNSFFLDSSDSTGIYHNHYLSHCPSVFGTLTFKSWKYNGTVWAKCLLNKLT